MLWGHMGTFTVFGLFTLPDPDSTPYGYIVLFRSFHIGSDPDPYSDGFPNGLLYPFLGMDLRPSDRSLSLLHTFQSWDQSLNLNQCEISA